MHFGKFLFIIILFLLLLPKNIYLHVCFMADGTRSNEDAALPHQTEAVPCSQPGSFYHPACVTASCLGLEQYPSGKPGVVKIWHSAFVFSRTTIFILTSSLLSCGRQSKMAPVILGP